MRTRERVAARFYKSSDRTHVTPIRWTKRERAQWEGQSRDSAARVVESVSAGDLCNAYVILTQMPGSGISTSEAREAERMFFTALKNLLLGAVEIDLVTGDDGSAA